MTAILPERPAVFDGLLAVGLTERRVPAWITDPDAIESILDGHYEIPDDLNPQPTTPTARPCPGIRDLAREDQ